MSDNLRRYRALRAAFTPCYPGQPTGTVARHLTTLAALIRGIVAQEPPTAQRRHQNSRWRHAREPGQTLDPMARQ